jgi:hypothetical protein
MGKYKMVVMDMDDTLMVGNMPSVGLPDANTTLYPCFCISNK